MKKQHSYFTPIFNLGAILVLSTLFGCNSDSSTDSNINKVPIISIQNFTCLSESQTNVCRDVGTLVVEFKVRDSDNNIATVQGEISSKSLGVTQNMDLVDGKLQVNLLNFSGIDDLELKVTVSDELMLSSFDVSSIGTVSANLSPTCNKPTLDQNFDYNANGGSVALIDISSCSDSESDQIILLNNILDTKISGNYTQTITVVDKFGSSTDYLISGNVAPANLTTAEFINQLIASPNAVGADSCFLPINRVFDEVVICDFSGEWHGFQYQSNQNTSSFANIALVDSAQGFHNFLAASTLTEIVSGYNPNSLPDNQVVLNPVNESIAITATIDREPNGNFINSIISGKFSLQGAATENSTVSCENQSYILPVNITSGSRSSFHSIDQLFVENIAQTLRISNCIATNASGIQTPLEGDIDIVVNDISNQNPQINSVTGITQGFEGVRTVVADITDPDGNLSMVSLRYRIAASNAEWVEIPLVQQAATNLYSASVTFDYITNLDEVGRIEYQIAALDSFGGQTLSALTNTQFFANEATAQSIINNEINLDANKTASCFDCNYVDPASGATIGPFDALYIDTSQVNHAYEYNGENRTAAEMANLAASVAGTIYNFHEIPIGTISQIRTDIQNN